MQEVFGPIPVAVSRDFEPVPGGTRMTYTLESDTSGVLLFRLMGPYLTRRYGKRLDGYLQALKEMLETKPPASGGRR